MNLCKIDKIRKYSLRKAIDKRNEKSLEIKEIDAKNIEIICFERELIEKQLLNNYSKQIDLNKDKKIQLTLLSRLINLIYNYNDKSPQIRKKLNPFSEVIYIRIPGYIFGIIGLVIQIFSTYLALLLYYTVDPTYSIYKNWISELGVGPNGANIVFCMGWILSSGFLFLLNDHFTRLLQKKMKNYTMVYPLKLFNIIFSLGIFLVGLFPANLLAHHYIGAVIYFYGGFLFFSYYGILALFNKGIPRFHGLIALILSTCFLIFVLSPYLNVKFFEFRITTTSAEWSIFIFETSLMLLILKKSMMENCSLWNVIEGQMFI